MPHGRAANRILSLAELKEPFFARTVRALESLTRKETVSYLHPSKRWEYPWALEQAGLAPGDRVLDAGCGASIFPVYLAREGFRTAACDLEVPTGLGRLHGVEIAGAAGDLTALPFQDGCFTAVFSISVIEHLPRERIPAALAELRRVLAPGGRLLLTTDYYRRADADLWYQGPGEPFRVDWNVFDEPLLSRLILSAPGFRVRGGIDLAVDWHETSPRMLAFHGYPYTSVGIRLERAG